MVRTRTLATTPSSTCWKARSATSRTRSFGLRAAPGISFDVRRKTQSLFNEKLQQALRSTVWAAGCKSWYIAESGKIVNNWSSFTFTYRRLTRHFDVVNYEVLTRSVASPTANESRGARSLEPVSVNV